VTTLCRVIETGRYKKIPRHLRKCNTCETIDDENHFFLNCNLNEHLRKAFLSDFDNINNTNLLEIILNPTNIKQVKSLGCFIKQSLELRTGGTWFHLFYCVLNLFICCTMHVYVLLTIQCSHWPWLGWKLCLIKLLYHVRNVHLGNRQSKTSFYSI
jgi:hypothetical protein